MSVAPTRSFHVRGFVSLFLTLNAILLTISGLLLYVIPEGRVARWAGWHFLGVDKGGWEAMHTIASFAFVVAVIFHILYNWKVLLFYLRNRATRAFSLKGELLVSLGLTGLLVFGSISLFPPFGTIMELGGRLKEAWYGQDVQAPYGHAEQSPLRVLASRQGFDLTAAIEVLREAGVSVTSGEQSLEELYALSGISPMALYNAIQDDPRTLPAPVPVNPELRDDAAAVAPSGLGRMSLEQVCREHGIALEHALQALRHQGIVAQGSETLRVIGERAGLTPTRIYELIGAAETDSGSRLEL
ncbi:hypothetical protein Selin_2451 [Desulfurispirillum indicum S5]|uniref:Flavinylation-associated cytochrome domain-containing protein n=1 Tax=Desulfurispirillum indicum (strain ATCC BAA-1389 / DSM 22839 / S5) TaxID=653733 RepID=E6W587_DESIS|nr:DUF4405 domain-containing protein [Desulfurispirillum indicum]ADU67166.1 hypothetical protein Selin_2451 [Desulfurispirillum indicum S5]